MVDGEVLGRIRGAMSGLRQAEARDAVGNDECSYSFDTPWSEGGLYINLKTYRGVGAGWLARDAAASGAVLYAHSRYRRVPKETSVFFSGGTTTTTTEKESNEEPPSVLGVGLPGGFAAEDDAYEVVKSRALAVVGDGGKPDLIPLPNDEVPEFASMLTNSVLDHSGGSLPSSAIEQWAVDDGPPKISKYAENLPYVAGAPKLSADPKTWKCGLSGDDENLWLNLSTGFVGGGRDQSAFGGPKGSNGALRHFEDTGKMYPLVVKLGTISKAGAEVYSYAPDEDCRVDDPKLAEHLARFGIEIMKLSKTEKTTAELEIDANAKFEWSAISEAGETLVPLSGPGLQGLVNLGNSCYMNSVVQLLAAVPSFEQQYSTPAALEQCLADNRDPRLDLLAQTAKLVRGVVSGEYAKPPELLQRELDRFQSTVTSKIISSGGDDDEEEAKGEKKESSSPGETLAPMPETLATAAKAARVSPRAFKHAFGKDHVDFSTGQQQDAAEYMGHVLELLARAERASAGVQGDTRRLFAFKLRERTACGVTGMARYKETVATRLDLPVPKAAHTDDDAPSEEPESKKAKTEPRVVPFADCLAAWMAESTVDDFYSSATGARGPAAVSSRLASAPPFLLVKLNRYYVDLQTWEPKKMDVRIDVPLTLDLAALKAPAAPDPDEALLPEDPATPTAGGAPPAGGATVVPDEAILAQLVSMGFDENGCRRACLATNNAGAEAAMEWVLTHSGDPGFGAPLDASDGPVPGPGPGLDDETAVAEMASLGFTSDQARAALRACDGSKERAADWLFSHVDDLDSAVAAVLSGTTAQEPSVIDVDDSPSTRYSLVGFISHIGKNTGSGHYVAHVRKPGHDFVIFDDEKVAKSSKPPLGLGYLYLYQRI